MRSCWQRRYRRPLQQARPQRISRLCAGDHDRSDARMPPRPDAVAYIPVWLRQCGDVGIPGARHLPGPLLVDEAAV